MLNVNDLPPTSQRVAMNTDPEANAEIRAATLRNIDKYRFSSPQAISSKIGRLEQEWDTERFLEANAAAAVLATSILGMTTSKYWFLITAGVGAFLLQHSLQGWCPPLAAIRKRGIRTATEINSEKVAMKIMRGDFDMNYLTVGDVLAAVEK